MKWGTVFVAPYIIGLLFFFIIPVACLVYFSFTDYDLFNPPKFVGFKNYINVLKSPETWRAFRNVSFFAIIYIPLNVFLACVLGVALNQKIKGITAFRTIYFLPNLLPWVSVSMVFILLFNPLSGSVNYALSLLGIGPFEFTFSQSWMEVIASMAVMQVWKGVGYASLFALGGLQNISGEIMEAAEIDGAGTLSKFFKITIPMITPTIFMLIIFGLSNSLQVFDSFFVMLGSGGIVSSEFTVVNMLIYDNAFQYGKIGVASAVCWVAFAFALTITLIQKATEKRWVHYE